MIIFCVNIVCCYAIHGVIKMFSITGITKERYIICLKE